MPEQPLKIALVHDHLVQDGGAERVVRTLMKMYPEAPLYTLLYDPQKMGPDFAGKDIRTSIFQKLPGALTYYKALLPFIDWAFRRFDLSDYDVVISSASGWAKGVRTPGHTPHICYCHTPIRYLWSDSERYIKELPFPAPLKWVIKLIRPWLRKNDRRAARGVDTFVANSRFVAERIKHYYNREATVIYPPVEVNQFAPSAQSDDYYLVATRLEPYKRVDVAIQAFNALRLPLRIMGSGTDAERLKQLAGPTVSFTGRVTDEERARLFARALALVHPQEEDFGITAVEALASGTPVIAFGAGGAAEVIEDGRTGLLFTPQTPEALSEIVHRYDRSYFDSDVLCRRSTDFSEERFISELEKVVGS